MSASWYDVLGVDPDASTEEIRAAWKGSIDDLDPGDRRFRLYNSAAEVLLDDQARADYDRELVGDVPEDETAPVETGADEAGRETAPHEGAQAETAPEPASEDENPTESEDADTAEAEDGGPTESEVAADGGNGPERTGAGGPFARRTDPTWILALLAVLVVAVAGAALKLHLDASSEAELADSVREARSAAEQNMPLVFSYDYRHPEQDHDRATRVLTGEQLNEYERLWKDGIEPNLESSKGVVSSETVRSGVVNSDDDGNRVEVLLVLSTKQANATQQTELTIPMTVTMVEEDGTWLISRVCAGGSCGGESPQPTPGAETSPSGRQSGQPSPAPESPSGGASPSNP